MEAAEKFARQLGTAPACRAFGVPRTSLYRRRQQEAAPRAPRRRPPSHRALTEVERQEVLDVLHSERFLDQAPAQVAAALLDEDRYRGSGADRIVGAIRPEVYSDDADYAAMT